jgi:hypothetical protein
MTQHRSINQRLARAKSPEAKQYVLLTWADEWQKEQMQLLSKLGKAVEQGEYDTQCIMTGELKAMSLKKFAALPKLLTSLLHNND